METHGASGVGTDGKGSSTRVVGVAVDDEVHMRTSGGSPLHGGAARL